MESPSIGEYEVKAMAIDNGGVGSVSSHHIVHVVEPSGEKPVAVWHGPLETPRVNSDSSWWWFGSSSSNYLPNDLEWGSTIFLNVQAFDPSYINDNGETILGELNKLPLAK